MVIKKASVNPIMPSTMKFQSRIINDYVNEKMRYIIKEQRFETQEEVLIRLLKIGKAKKV